MYVMHNFPDPVLIRLEYERRIAKILQENRYRQSTVHKPGWHLLFLFQLGRILIALGRRLAQDQGTEQLAGKVETFSFPS